MRIKGARRNPSRNISKFNLIDIYIAHTKVDTNIDQFNVTTQGPTDPKQEPWFQGYECDGTRRLPCIADC